tara:strand:- start:755 stop:1114 length:360 start_codon:yes stop_codon:yes gene_type:complete
MKDIIYISGPISGKNRSEVARIFSKAETMLSKKGYTVINPVSIPCHTSRWIRKEKVKRAKMEGEWCYYMRESLIHLMNSDLVYMLDGWSDSKGASLEHETASSLGFRIIYEEKRNGMED